MGFRVSSVGLRPAGLDFGKLPCVRVRLLVCVCVCVCAYLIALRLQALCSFVEGGYFP